VKKPANVTDPKIVKCFMALFDGYKASHGTHGKPTLDGLKWIIKPTAKTLPGPPTEDLFQQHLDGKLPLGVVPIRNDSTCVWGSIDIDKYNIDLLEVVGRVEALPLVPCRSKSGGMHLFLFTSEPVPAALMQQALRNMAITLGFADSEIFPKQTEISEEREDGGSWMVMPYYGGTFGGKLKLQYGLKKKGGEQTLEEFLDFAEKRKVTADEMAKLAKPTLTAVVNTRPQGTRSNVVSLIKDQKSKSEWRREREEAWRDLGSDPNEAFADGPCCLQLLARSGFPEGSRNNALFQLGIYTKRAFPDTWETQLEKDNQMYMKPPLKEAEVSDVQKSLKKKPYEYKCKDQPMVSHCDTAICMTRRHGVGQGTTFPSIEYIDKESGDETVFYVKLKGIDQEVELNSGKQLTRLPDFRDACAGQVQFSFELFADKIWVKIYRHALLHAGTRMPDMTRRMHFGEILENWLTNRGRGPEPGVDALVGVGRWDDDDNDRYLFRLSRLSDFLNQEKFKHTLHEIGKWVREDFGAYRWQSDDPDKNNQGKRKIKGKAVIVWCIPKGNITEITEELDQSPEPKEHI
jgi:hypothetical protein